MASLFLEEVLKLFEAALQIVAFSDSAFVLQQPQAHSNELTSDTGRIRFETAIYHLLGQVRQELV
jgi:hypothetical protein